MSDYTDQQFDDWLVDNYQDGEETEKYEDSDAWDREYESERDKWL